MFFQRGTIRLYIFLSVLYLMWRIYYLFPSFFFLFGIVPVYPYPPVIIGMLLYVGITRLILELITRGRTNFLMDEVYSVIRSFIYLMALPALVFNKNIRFKVTPKDGRKSIVWQGVVGPVLVFGCNLAAVAVTALHPSKLTSLGVLGWVCFGWCLYMGGTAFMACRYSFIQKKT